MNNNELKLVVSAKDQASATIQRVQGNIDTASSKVSASMEKVRGAAQIAAAGIAAVGAATLGATTVGIKFNSAVEQAEAQIMAFTKDAAKTAETLAWVKEEAAKTQFSFTDMAQATAGLIPAAKSANISLETLVKQAEVLAALNPSEGLTGAAFALREALSGDFVSVVERFNLPRQRLNELKAQGIPAIEAIRRALEEMGIDFSIVEAQGQTTAARWDQLKDKLTMLAGEATKPIFDKVSKELEGMPAKIDTAKASFGSLMSGFQGENTQALDENSKKFFDLGENLRKLWDTVYNFLKPAFDELVRTYKDKLAPELEKLRPYLDDIAKIIGAVLVVAIWVFINVLIILVKTVGDVLHVFFELKERVSNAFDAVVDFFRRMPDRVGGALGFLKDKIIAPFQGAFDYVKTLPGKMVDLFANIGGSIKRVIGDIDIPGPLGKVRDVIPGFATGGSVVGGQPIVVGERQAEVYIPNTRGRIQPSTAGSDTGTGVTNNYLTGNFYFENAESSNAFFDRIDKTARLSRMGVA